VEGLRYSHQTRKIIADAGQSNAYFCTTASTGAESCGMLLPFVQKKRGPVDFSCREASAAWWGTRSCGARP